ncbi:2-oxo acid dehydrogenase subunit E2 [Paracandidimonas lactea]|uniref:2-oxo acid dehydrogenase subunit E2 n=1 Tax=Paracandidimonas lactea TaxID=2895524 RepID=UPI001EF0C974|nr:2-oxo acid dehydrogenase subunit E2 [Paracandidimonas lactea]
MRKTIARRLSESKATVPHCYLSQTFRVDKLLALRAEVNTQREGQERLSVNDFIIRAVALTLRDVPQANVRWTEEGMLHFDHADISVAVSTDSRLITPIVRCAETKAVSAISAEMAGLVVRAREAGFKPEEFQGGTFAISNMGMYGIENFVAIINPPQAGILAVGAIRQAPVVEEGEIVAASVMGVTLSADHRAMDGAVAAKWMQKL